MGGFTVRIEGLKELDAKLTELGTKIATKVIKDGLVAGGRVFQAAVQSRAPERPELPSGTALPPGALAQDIELKLNRQNSEGLPAVIVAPGKYTQHVARWVEYGHALVRRASSGFLRLHIKGGGLGQVVGHVPAHPFIRPGYEAARSDAIKVACETIARGVEEAAKK